MPRNRGHNAGDSNLFKIDFDTIERVLEDANSGLLKKADEILRQAEDLPSVIESKSEAEKFRELIQDFRSLTKDVSHARLADGRPFTEAAKVVKEWFSETENNLKKKEAWLSRQLADFAVQTQRDSRSSEHKPGYIETPIGTSVDGDPVVSITQPESYREPDPAPFNVELEWEIKSFDISQLPIEQLRDYFSDHSIRQALKKHLDKNGPNQIRGVEYIQSLGKKIEGAGP